MKKVLPFLCLLLVFTSCGSKYKVEGVSSVSTLDGKMLFIKAFQDGDWVTLDSAEVVHGLFSMKGKVDTILMTTLYMDEESIMPLVLESGNIKISITNTQITASGTPLNDALYNFIEEKNTLDLQLDDLQRKEARMVLEGGNISQIQEQIAREEKELINKINAFVKKFISDNYNTVLGPSVFIMLCSSLPYPVMTPQIEDILKDAPYTFKTNNMVKEYVSKAKENMEVIKERQKLLQNDQNK